MKRILLAEDQALQNYFLPFSACVMAKAKPIPNNKVTNPAKCGMYSVMIRLVDEFEVDAECKNGGYP